MAVANCPSCGGQIEFKIGSSAAVICDHCRTVGARTDRGLAELLGATSVTVRECERATQEVAAWQ